MTKNSKIQAISTKDVPRHIAIIMDGNGRWAKDRGLPRSIGHRNGADAVKRVVKAAAEIGVEYLTLFGFSSENWARPVDEIKELMKLLRLYLRSETADLHRNNIRLNVIGQREHLEDDIVELIENAEKLTQHNDAMTVNIALNYGGRVDIMLAASKWAKHCIDNNIEPDLMAAETYFPEMLMTGSMPDPDILIRTSGEQRISNFLLWQCAYAELIFTPVYWPDFGQKDLESAIEEYRTRERRFGAVGASGINS